ncbi:MAG: protein phosphatase 2C domain-containing protein [Lentisphaeria bacterium]|nr:protein phosphatase 2C domain-containing protein [Lentisphaeria bacterium]
MSKSHPTIHAFDVAGASHIGRVRQANEDSFLTVYLPGAPDTFLAVADGVGGCDVGDIASQLVVRKLLNARLSSGLCPGGRVRICAESMREAVREANLFLFKLNHQFGNTMFTTGTTLSTLHLFDQQAMVFNIGDSRCYRLRKGKLEPLTHDDTVVQQWVEEKKITRKEAVSHPLGNTLYRCVGTEPTVTTGFRQVPCARGDRFMLATDGVWKMLAADQMTLALGDAATAREAVDRLILGALREGSRDNLSACVALVR